MGRRILRVDATGASVAREARFASEEQLHHAVAAHPEVLPNEDFGLRTLVPLANELDLSAGPMDLLAADGQGRLVIVEFKRGTENPDVRQVVAQILDYGAALWRYDYEALEEQCRRLRPGFTGSLVDHVAEKLGALDDPFDAEVFREGVEATLDSGSFIFVYCGRNLDERTRRIMTYLAEGPRMAFFGVEVDYYREGVGEGAVLVPRTVFVPSWITGPESAVRRGGTRMSIADAPPEFEQLVARMDELTSALGLQKSRRATGWSYLPPEIEEGVTDATSGIGIYASRRGFEINLSVLRALGQDNTADELLGRLEAIVGVSLQAGQRWPSVSWPCNSLLHGWERLRAEVIEPYFQARMQRPIERSAGESPHR